MGRVTRHRTREGEAPREEAISSRPSGLARSAASRVTMRKGSETKTWATTTAAVEKAMETPHASIDAPMGDLRPNAASRAIPATTGGKESGRATSTLKKRTRRQSRESSTAAGTPRTRSMASAAAQVRRDSPRAATDSSEARIWGSRPHGTRPAMKTRGSTRNARASPPTAAVHTGTGLTAGARRFPTGSGYLAAGVKPARSRTDWPSGDRTRAIHFWASSAFFVALTWAIGYLLTAWSAPWMSMVST